MKAGDIVNKGNYRLVKKIESLDEFWEVISTNKSLYARHKIYASAFFFSWCIKTVKTWIESGFGFQKKIK